MPPPPEPPARAATAALRPPASAPRPASAAARPPPAPAAPAAAPAAADPGGASLRSTPTEREIVVETARRATPSSPIAGRAAHALAVEGAIATPAASRSTWCRRPTGRRDAAVLARGGRRGRQTARLNDALYRVSGDARRQRIDATTSAGGAVVRVRERRRPSRSASSSRFEPTGYIVTFTADGAHGRPRRSTPAILWGPGLGDEIARAPARRRSSRATTSIRRKASSTATARSTRFAGADGRRRPERSTARSASPASTTTTSSPRCVDAAGPSARRLRARCRCPIRDGRRDARQLVSLQRHASTRRRSDAARSSSARSSSTCCARSTPSSRKAINFGMFAFLVVPLLGALQVGPRLRRQLRLVDHHPDDPHQPGDVPAAPQERRVDAEDAGAPAAAEGDPGSLRAPEGDRSRRARR